MPPERMPALGWACLSSRVASRLTNSCGMLNIPANWISAPHPQFVAAQVLAMSSHRPLDRFIRLFLPTIVMWA